MEQHFDHHTLLRSIRILLIILIILFSLSLLLPRLESLWTANTVEPRAVTARGALSTTEKSNIDLFEEISPSVVYITTLADRLNYWTRDITRIPKGTGSGFIWDTQGHIITNYHVLEGASAVRIQLSDQRTFDATLVGASPDHDLAVLKIAMTNPMPRPIPIGTSEDLKVGQLTYAIGNPFGLDQTLTTGVVSALNRSLSAGNGATIEGLIQTDAAINPGNSGGPLLDSAGRLIGINTAIYSPSGAYAGIGFAVPVDTVNRIIPKIISQGHYKRPKLGITISDKINKMIYNKFGLKGVAVIDVRPHSSAQRAGLRGVNLSHGKLVNADVICGIDNHNIEDTKTLLSVLEKYNAGDTVQVKVCKDKLEQYLSVVLE